MPQANARSERQANKDETERLKARIALLERDLRRAARCLEAERYGREQLRGRLHDAERDYQFAVSVLCKLAFPE